MPEILENGVKLYEPEDTDSLRTNIFDKAKEAFGAAFPLRQGGLRLELTDLNYANEKDFTPEEQKKAIMHDEYLARSLKAGMRLVDENSGEVLSEVKPLTVMRIPWLSQRGTFIHNGSEYVTANQARLQPGAFTRIRDNGGIETQFNTKMGTGSAMRVELEPATAQYRLRLGDTSNLHFYSLLNQIGVTDAQMSEAWGDDILQRNKDSFDVRTLDKVYKQLVKPKEQNSSASAEEKAEAVKAALNRALVSRRVVEKTLPNMFSKGWVKSASAAANAERAVSGFYDAEEVDAAVFYDLRKSAAMGAEDMAMIATYLNQHHDAGIDTNQPSEMLEASILGFISEDPKVLLNAQIDNMDSGAPLQNLETLSKSGSFDLARQAIVAGILVRHPEEFVKTAASTSRVHHTLTGVVVDVPEFMSAMVALESDMVKKAADDTPCFAVDLDGTLAHHDPEATFDPEHIGPPVPEMWARVKLALEDGCKVKIFTARAATPANIPFVEKWLKEHGLEGLEVTNKKTPDILEIWDDRAVNVAINTGKMDSPSLDLSKERMDKMKASLAGMEKSACVTTPRGFCRSGAHCWIAESAFDGYSAMVKFAAAKFEKLLQEARDATGAPKSEAQAEAGNYPKGKVRWNGLVIAIENPKGSIRKGKGWKIKMPMDYGYFKGLTGADGEGLDVFITDDAGDAKHVFVINQTKEAKGEGGLDEHKVIIGPITSEDAIDAYCSCYSEGWSRYTNAVRFSVPEFIAWAGHADMTKPAKKKDAIALVKSASVKAPESLEDVMDGRDAYTPVGVRGLLAASEKLLMVSRGDVKPDVRDSAEFKRFHTPDALLAERIKLDTTGMRRKIMHMASRRRNLSMLTPRMFDGEAHGLIVGNPLSSPLEEINPMQLMAARRRVTQMGPGGIGSDDAITPAMQAVHASQFGFISPIEGPECFDSLTEVYTERGWVAWDKVSDSDVFACRVEGELQWHKADRLVVTDYKGDMILGENESIRMCVTPSHRVINTRDVSYRIDTACDVYGKQIRIPVTHKPYVGKDLRTEFRLAKIDKTNNNQREFDSFDVVDWAEFLGWWLSEGSLYIGTRKPKNGGACYAVGTVNIAQSRSVNPDKHARIQKLLVRMRLIKESTGLEYDDFSISAKQLVAYFKRWNMGCYDKWIPSEVFDWSVEARRALLDALLLGDGRWNKKRMCYCTVSQRLALDVERLAVSLGYPAFIRIEKDNRPHVKTQNFVVSISRAKHRTIRSGEFKHKNGKTYGGYWSRIPYEGKVYCATVPGGLLLVRGKVASCGFWSGNSARAGIDTRLAMGVRFGDDGKLYQKFRRPGSQDTVWLAHDDIANKVIGIPK